MAETVRGRILESVLLCGRWMSSFFEFM